MIDVTDLSFAYDGHGVLADVSFAVDRGERLAIVGANGAGKTTLLRLLAGLLEADSGSVRVAGSVGFAPEDPQSGLFAATVRDEVAFFPRNRGLAIDPAVRNALEVMELTVLADRNPFTLSVGEQRRVSIASVLSGDPDVLVLDEPTTGLDRRGSRDLAGLLDDIDHTIVFSTHDTDFAHAIADRVAIVAGAGIRQLGPAGEVLGGEGVLLENGIRPPGLVEFARQENLDRVPTDVDAAIAMLRERQ
mgnify:CR=1 FL=1